MCAKVITIKNGGKQNIEEEPLAQYRKEVDEGTFSTLPYERLMIHYRKQQDYAEEVKVIRKGISALKGFYAGLQKSALHKKINTKVKALSRKLGTSMGLIDKKGNDLYLPDPLPKWIRRQKVAEDKWKKQQEKIKTKNKKSKK